MLHYESVVIHIVVHDGVDKVGRPKYRGVTHAVRSVIREDGLLGLYRVSVCVCVCVGGGGGGGGCIHVVLVA